MDKMSMSAMAAGSDPEIQLGFVAAHRRRLAEAQAEDRRRRNAEVDSLIQQMATDPKVAEKLRIYRMVEQQFGEIESQVRQEVTRDIRESCQAKHNVQAKGKKSEAHNVAGEFAVIKHKGNQ